MKYSNNPLNIRISGSHWHGQTGFENGFCLFCHVTFGVRAGLYLLLRTYPRRGWLTIEDVISHWAPAADGNNVESYIDFVCCGDVVDVLKYFEPCTVVKDLALDDLYIVVARMCKMESSYHLSYSEFYQAYKLL